MNPRLATRMSLRYLAAALVAGLALSFAPTAPALADEYPGVRAPRVRMPPPRVRVRTAERVRSVPVYDTHTCGGCAVVWQAPRYYAPRYYAAGCGGCAQWAAAPYYWAVRYARYRHAHHYHY